MAQMDGITQNLQTLYEKWKNKYMKVVVLTNYALQDFPEKLKEVDLIMCPKNTPEEVYHFVKFCKKIMEKLITDIEALCESQGVTFSVYI